MTEPMDDEVGRTLALLREKIRLSGFTQQEVQQELGWGTSYLSQLFNRQKGARVEQVLRVLDVLGIDRGEFYAELYDIPTGLDASSPEIRQLRARALGLVRALINKGVVKTEEVWPEEDDLAWW